MGSVYILPARSGGTVPEISVLKRNRKSYIHKLHGLVYITQARRDGRDTDIPLEN
jgi:hypothetical protein